MSAPDPITVLDQCADLLRCASLTGLQLAVHMGESVQAMPEPAEDRMPRLDEVLVYAARPDGVTVQQACALMRIGYPTAHTYIRRLRNDGRLTAAVSNVSNTKHWFADPAAAAAWSPPAKPNPEPKPRKQGKPGALLVARQIGTLSPAPAAVKARGGVAIITDETKITRVPAPLGRYEVRPGDVVVGAGFGAEWKRLRGEVVA